MDEISNGELLVQHTIDVVTAYVGQNTIKAEDVPAFIASTHAAIAALDGQSKVEPEAPAETFTPAVTARKSLGSKDHIISMIDGKPYKTLRRHLSTHGLSPEDYRTRYNLPANYPMVAPNYSEARRSMAKKIGLGRKPGQTAGSAAPKAAAAPKPKAAPKAPKAPKAPAEAGAEPKRRGRPKAATAAK